MPTTEAPTTPVGAAPGLSRMVTARAWAGTGVRVLLAGVWIWAGVGKIGDPAGSVRAVRAYQLLPEWLAKGVGYGLPYLEIGLALLLLAGLATRLAAVLSAALLVVFLGGMISAAARGLRIECGCFGGGGDLSEGGSTRYTVDILRDAGLLLAAGFLAVWPRSRLAADDLVRDSVPGADSARVGPRRTKAARQRLAALLEQRRRAGDRRVRVVSAACAVALAGVLAAGIGIQAARVGGPAGPQPQAVAVDSGVVVGRASAKVTIDVYEDLQCPACKQFEATAAPVLAQAVDNGTVRVRYRVVAFLDRMSSTKYSSRSANAAYCAADAGVFVAYHDLLYQHQPPEGGDGLPDEQLISYGQQAGATGDAFAQCVRSDRYGSFVDQITERTSVNGVVSTPTVLVNRTPLTELTGAGLRAAIQTAS